MNNYKVLLCFYVTGITGCSSYWSDMNMGDRSREGSPSSFRKSDLKERPEYRQARDRVLREDEQREQDRDRSSAASPNYSVHAENIALDFARSAQREQAAAARAYGSSEGHTEVGKRKAAAAKAALKSSDKYKEATDRRNLRRSRER